MDEVDKLDKEVEMVEEEDKDAMEVVENAQTTDGIQIKEGNDEQRNEVAMNATNGKQNKGSNEERNNETTDDGKKRRTSAWKKFPTNVLLISKNVRKIHKDLVC